jgi:hypothetical protein
MLESLPDIGDLLLGAPTLTETGLTPDRHAQREDRALPLRGSAFSSSRRTMQFECIKFLALERGSN